MSEPIAGQGMSASPAEAEAAQEGLTAGALLRAARESSGVQMAALAGTLKVSVSKLEALESDNFSALPDTVFVRALASSICRTLKLDPAPILSLLPQSRGAQLPGVDVGINAPVKQAAAQSSLFSFSGPKPQLLIFAVVVLLIGAVVMFFLPLERHTRDAGPVVTPGVTPSALNQGQERPARVDVPAQAASAATMRADDKTSSTPAEPGAAMTAPPPTTAPSSEASASAPAPEGILVFRARSESWIQVRDAAGMVVLQRKLLSGEMASTSGALPLSVVVGRADATEVFVRGKPFELVLVSKENVARFEVK